MAQAWSDYIPEGSAPDRLKKSLSLAMRRTQYGRLPLDGDSPSSLAIEVPSKPNLLRSRTTARTPDLEADVHIVDGAHEEVPPSPSVWGKVRDAYVSMMVKTADDASETSVVPVAKQLDRSLTLGSGFGKKVEVQETRLPFKLNKMEQQYLDHLRKRYDSRYA